MEMLLVDKDMIGNLTHGDYTPQLTVSFNNCKAKDCGVFRIFTNTTLTFPKYL